MLGIRSRTREPLDAGPGAWGLFPRSSSSWLETWDKRKIARRLGSSPVSPASCGLSVMLEFLFFFPFFASSHLS